MPLGLTLPKSTWPASSRTASASRDCTRAMGVMQSSQGRLDCETNIPLDCKSILVCLHAPLLCPWSGDGQVVSVALVGVRLLLGLLLLIPYNQRGWERQNTEDPCKMLKSYETQVNPNIMLCPKRAPQQYFQKRNPVKSCRPGSWQRFCAMHSAPCMMSACVAQE